MTPMEASEKMGEILKLAPVVPVLVIKDPAKARPLAQALIAGGLRALEVTLRTPAALEVITEMAGVEGGVVGAGTLLTPADAKAAKRAGARFGVSPGATDRLLAACAACDLPLLPGASTASEVMRLFEQGYRVQKFFPAEAAGGAPFLRALCAPLPRIRFCPTGGITPANAGGYLSLPNVISVGGSWIAPPDLIAAGDWATITARAQQASRLGAPVAPSQV